jgi:phosphotransferase system enzyme I (PtsP)
MAGKPIEAMALLGLGLTSISMNPAAIGPVKAMLRALDVSALQKFLLPLLKSGEESLRGALSRFASQHSVPL